MTAELYQALVLDHQRAPRNFGPLRDASHRADGANILCGDHLHVELRVADNVIDAIGFTAEACAITVAATSMLSDLAVGLDATALAEFEARFAAYLRGEAEADARFGDLVALGELKKYPARRQCALLPFATLRTALSGGTLASTEKDAP